jgi:transcriptional regulator with XRE-family HTH domain
MSTTNFDASPPGTDYPATVSMKLPIHQRPLHQLAVVRRREGLSRRAVARRLRMDVMSVKEQEQQGSDMTLSRLYEWQEALGVPVAELLIDTDEALSPPILKRAQMLRLMKTAAAILERTQQTPVRRMAQMMVEQIVEIMPELEGVSPWNAVGQRRTLDELGQAAQRRLSLDALADLME